MKNKRKHVTAFLIAMMLLFAAGCANRIELGPLPTLAPTNTPAPEVDTPAPTGAPDADYARIVELDGEDFNQTAYFNIEGEGTVSVKSIYKSGRYSFCMSGRGESWHGISFDVKDINGSKVDVVGKNMFLSMWVYHESDKPESFTCTMQVKKPDETTDTPIELVVSDVPSHTWTLLEGVLPVYANVSDPKLRIEMTTGNASFYFDDFRLSYDQKSVVGPNVGYNVLSFPGIYLDFESGDNPFVGRAGTETMTVAKGGKGGQKCLITSGRTENWNGPSMDISEYGLSGATIWVSFAATHGGKGNTPIKCTIQELPYGVNDESLATYTQIAITESLAAGQWGEVTGSYTLKADTERAILYFETDQTEDILLDNFLLTAKDPATIEINKQTGEIIDKVDRIDTSDFVNLYTLTADGMQDQTATFINNSNVLIDNDSNGYAENGFRVYERNATWSGAGIHIANDGYADQVIGKEVYVSFWVYQNSGETQQFSATLQANKPDGTAVWPERVAVEVIPSGEWTYVEGMIPIYANVSVPQINFEMPSSAEADYYLDNVIISYDPNSNVPVYEAYEDTVKVKEKLNDLVLTFEDNNAFFIGRGNGKASIVYGGYESDNCLYVSERSLNWHGVVADFSNYDIIGRTVNVSFWMCHDYDEPLQVYLSAEQNDGSNTEYIHVLEGNVAADGKWVYFSGSYEVPETVKKIYFYFESENETASFYLDDITFDVVY